MASVKIVTDSTADIPLDLAKKNNIHIVPLVMHFSSQALKDQTELTSEAFFARLEATKERPKTKEPPVTEFAALYKSLGADGSSVVSIHLSAQLSDTCKSAKAAADSVAKSVSVQVVDSRMTSMALGLRVLEANRAAQAGRTQSEIVQIANSSQSRTGVYFAVDTLDYMYANGKIGKATHLIGSMLGVKPILTLRDGAVTSYDRVMGGNKVISRLIEIVSGRITAGKRVNIAITHGNAKASADELAKEVRSHFNVGELVVSNLGAVLGAHTGPGTIALSYLMPE